MSATQARVIGFRLAFENGGNCFVNMKRGEAHAVISSLLAENPELVCQVLINTILTNFITRHGYSMLHASALSKMNISFFCRRHMGPESPQQLYDYIEWLQIAVR